MAPLALSLSSSTMEPHRGPRLVLLPDVQVPPTAWLLCDDDGGVAATRSVRIRCRARRLLVSLR